MTECIVATFGSEMMFLPSFHKVVVYSLDGSCQRTEKSWKLIVWSSPGLVLTAFKEIVFRYFISHFLAQLLKKGSGILSLRRPTVCMPVTEVANEASCRLCPELFASWNMACDLVLRELHISPNCSSELDVSQNMLCRSTLISWAFLQTTGLPENKTEPGVRSVL